TGSLSWNFRPARSLNVQVRPSEETSDPSHICGCGCNLLSTPYSVSKNNTEALRTTYSVVQIGSRLARLACGTNRSTLFSAARPRRGAASPAMDAIAPAAPAFSKPLRVVIPSGPVAFPPASRAGCGKLPERAGKRQRDQGDRVWRLLQNSL